MPDPESLKSAGMRPNRWIWGLNSSISLVALLFVILAGLASLLIVWPSLPTPSSLHACHVTADQLPTGTNRQGGPLPYLLKGQHMTITGSTALAPLIKSGTDTFDAVEGTMTTLNPTNSLDGLQKILAGQTDISMSDVFAADAGNLQPPSGGKLDDYLVAVVPFTLVVSADLQATVWNLTTSQIQDIFTQKKTNWHEIDTSLKDEPITALNRPPGSGTRTSFQAYVMQGKPIVDNTPTKDKDTEDNVLSALAGSKGAIGYVAAGSVVPKPNGQPQQAFPICIDGHRPTSADIATGDYHFWNIEHLYIKHGLSDLGIEALFLDFVCGGDFQAKNVLTLGFLHPTQLRDDVFKSHIPPAILESGGDNYETIQSCAIRLT